MALIKGNQEHHVIVKVDGTVFDFNKTAKYDYKLTYSTLHKWWRWSLSVKRKGFGAWRQVESNHTEKHIQIIVDGILVYDSNPEKPMAPNPDAAIEKTYWFIVYRFRDGTRSKWTTLNDVIDEHPLHWQIDSRYQNLTGDCDDNMECMLTFFKEITFEQYEDACKRSEYFDEERHFKEITKDEIDILHRQAVLDNGEAYNIKQFIDGCESFSRAYLGAEQLILKWWDGEHHEKSFELLTKPDAEILQKLKHIKLKKELKQLKEVVKYPSKTNE